MKMKSGMIHTTFTYNGMKKAPIHGQMSYEIKRNNFSYDIFSVCTNLCRMKMNLSVFHTAFLSLKIADSPKNICDVV